MANLEKYQGVIPAFYACYDSEGNVDTKLVEDPRIRLLSLGRP